MNNRGGMMTSLLTIGAAGAAIYGIVKGVQNGTFQKLPQTLSNTLNNQNAQQNNMIQGGQQLTNTLQKGANALQQMGDNNKTMQ